jgi:hypothetical protein
METLFYNSKVVSKSLERNIYNCDVRFSFVGRKVAISNQGIIYSVEEQRTMNSGRRSRLLYIP